MITNCIFSFKLDGYPIGNCASQNYLTVNIPDIECDKCYLQLVSIMTDKYEDEGKNIFLNYDNIRLIKF